MQESSEQLSDHTPWLSALLQSSFKQFIFCALLKLFKLPRKQDPAILFFVVNLSRVAGDYGVVLDEVVA